MSIGQIIKDIRIHEGLTQKQLGEKCGMADSAIRKYESGKVVPKLETLQRIANALGEDITVFIPTKLENPKEYMKFEPHLTPAQIKELADYDQETLEDIESGVQRDWEDRYFRLLEAYTELNSEGQEKAIERTKELSEIPRYKQDFSKIDKMVEDYKKAHGITTPSSEQLFDMMDKEREENEKEFESLIQKYKADK